MICMKDVKYLTKEEIIKIHERILEETEGVSGILNEGILIWSWIK